MTDQSKSNQTPVVVDAAPLIAQAVKEVPELEAVRPHLELVVKVYAQYLAGGKTMSNEDIEADLAVFFGTNLVGVSSAATQVLRVMLQRTTTICTQFKEITGRELDPNTLDVSKGLESELAEQTANREAAQKLQAQALFVIASLKITNLFEEGRQAAKAKDEAPQAKKDLFASLRAEAVKHGFLNAEPTAESDVPEPQEEVGWLTEPVLDPLSSEVKVLTAKLDRIQAVMSRFKSAQNMAELTLAALANLNMSRKDVEVLCQQALGIADEELSQVDRIIKTVRQDADDFRTELAAMRTVVDMVRPVAELGGGRVTKK